VIQDHYPRQWAACRAPLTPEAATAYSARQVFDLPAPQPVVVTEHRAHSCSCPQCGETTRAAFPEDVTAPVQYGARITAWILDLLHYQFVPAERLVQLMADLFGVKLAAATLARMSGACGRGFRDSWTLSPGGFRPLRSSTWRRRAFGSAARPNGCLSRPPDGSPFTAPPASGAARGRDSAGSSSNDHGKPYYPLTGVLHALCNAHHLRELEALVEIDKEAWALRMQRLLRRACHAGNLAQARGNPPTPRLIERFQRRYDAIAAVGLAFHAALPPLPARGKRGCPPRRTGHHLLLRLTPRRDDVLRFLPDPRVPFTNNPAEQAARMMKLRQKISGGFRAEQGARDFAVIRTVIATAQKQGWNIIHTLTQPPAQLIAQLRTE
jgi:transposase